jgi:short-subunit dehydrogenase
MARRLALVTGASSGIGAAFAREFARRGWDLALVARREDRLKDMAEELKAQFGVDSLVIAADLSKPDAPEAIIKAVSDAGRQVDALVNNAGVGRPGAFVELSWDDQAEFMELMVTSYLKLMHLVAKPMAERGFGRIINIASVSALLPAANAHTPLFRHALSGREKPSDQGVRSARARAQGPQCPCNRRGAGLYLVGIS